MEAPTAKPSFFKRMCYYPLHGSCTVIHFTSKNLTADVAEILSLDNRMGYTMKRMQMVAFLFCMTVSFKKSKHGTECAVHNGARQRDQSWRQQFSFLTDFANGNKKMAHLSSPLKYNFSQQNDFSVQFNSCAISEYSTTGGRKKTDLNLV